jgi:tetratricopeptide (TPR) repeat protein
MDGLQRRALLILACLAVLMGWAGSAVAHRRQGPSLIQPLESPAAQSPCPEAEATSGPLPLQPDAYLKRVLALERAGDYQEAVKIGLALVNLFPQAPQRGPALLRLAELAREQGKTAEALELLRLVAAMAPGTPEASQAGLAAGALELSRDLPQGNPVQALRRFLERVSGLPAGYSPDALQEALGTGWQAVARTVQATAPPQLPMLEEILALWDLQPQGMGPPEAAHLLADLLKKNGLVEEAQALLARAPDNFKGNRPKMLKTYGAEQPGLSTNSPGFTGTSSLGPDVAEEDKFLRPSWLPRCQAGVEPSANPSEALMAWFLPRKANAAWMEGQVPGLGPSLLYSRPASFPDRPRTDLGRCASPEAGFSRSTPPGRTVPDLPRPGDLGPFYQDRLGLNHLIEGQPDAAQATFQELAQHHDPFWQCLARVRLADLELSRLQAEPAP